MQSHSTVRCPETVENAQVGLGVGLGVGLLSVRCGVGGGVAALPHCLFKIQPSGLCTAILHSCACSSAPQVNTTSAGLFSALERALLFSIET